VLRLARYQPRDRRLALRREQGEGGVGVAEDAHVQRAWGGGAGGVGTRGGAEALVEASYAQVVGGLGGRAEGAVLRGGRLGREGGLELKARVRVRARARPKVWDGVRDRVSACVVKEA
jgi:hypothetical protein